MPLNRRPPAVRLIVGILLLLFGAGTLSCRLDGVAAEPRVSPWVRTVDGWERADSWQPDPPPPPSIHPLVVAAAQGLVSVLALVAFQDDKTAGRR